MLGQAGLSLFPFCWFSHILALNFLIGILCFQNCSFKVCGLLPNFSLYRIEVFIRLEV